MIVLLNKTHLGNNKWVVEYCLKGEAVSFTKVVQL